VKFGWGLRSIRADNAGAAIGTAFTLSMTGQYEGNPSATYNPATNQFLVAFKGWNNPNNFGFVQAQRVQAGTGQLVGAPALAYAGGGTYITDAAYNPETNQFLVAVVRRLRRRQQVDAGRIVDANGGLPGSVIALSTLWKAYDALGLAYNTRTGNLLHGVARRPRACRRRSRTAASRSTATAHRSTTDSWSPPMAAGAISIRASRPNADAPDWMLVAVERLRLDDHAARPGHARSTTRSRPCRTRRWCIGHAAKRLRDAAGLARRMGPRLRQSDGQRRRRRPRVGVAGLGRSPDLRRRGDARHAVQARRGCGVRQPLHADRLGHGDQQPARRHLHGRRLPAQHGVGDVQSLAGHPHHDRRTADVDRHAVAEQHRLEKTDS
jgi:hypothetical protein